MLRIFKSKLFFLVLATALILALIGISARENGKANWLSNVLDTAIYPFQAFFTFTGQKAESGLSFINKIKTVKQENAELKAEIEKLKKENRDLIEYKGKIKELQEALNIKSQLDDYESIGANIIAKDAGNWFNVFTIDRGSKDGIKKNFPVITGEGLVGKVISVSKFSSKVISIIDMDSTVFGRISKTRDYVRVKGDLILKDQGLCRMDYIPVDTEISVGDTVETSGLNDIFPRGILIGRIKEIRQTGNELDRYAVIEPAADFRRLEEVIILLGKTDNKIGSAER